MKSLIQSLIIFALSVAAHAEPNAVTVQWDAVQGASQYIVYRTDGATPVRIATTDKLTYLITNLPSTPSKYRVTASKDGVESNYSNEVTITVPSAPGNLKVVIEVTISNPTK